MRERSRSTGRGADRNGGSQRDPVEPPGTSSATPGTGPTARLPPELIKKLIKRRLGAIRFCYELALRTSPSLSTRVTVHFTIALDGTVSSATGSSDNAEPGLVDCVVKEVKRIQFPKPEGGVVRVSYPFSFSPASE